jgi:hypothetical protein
VEITTAVTAQAQALTQTEVTMSVLKLSLDINAEQGAALVKMMDQAGGLGQQVDLQG